MSRDLAEGEIVEKSRAAVMAIGRSEDTYDAAAGP